MRLHAFLNELTKIADAGSPSPSKPIPINAVAPRGPSIPHPGGLKLKLAFASNAMVPPASPAATAAGGALNLPRPSKLPGQTLNPVANAVPNHPSATNAATMPPPPQSGIFPTAARGVVQSPGPVTANSGRAYAASRAALAAPKRPGIMMKVGEDPGHGLPGHDHKASVEKLRAAMKEKHPHLLAKTADMASMMGTIKNTAGSVGKHLIQHEDAHEIAGLGALAVPSIDSLQARLRGGNEENSKQILPESVHDAMEIGGLGYLAAPMIAKGRMPHISHGSN